MALARGFDFDGANGKSFYHIPDLDVTMKEKAKDILVEEVMSRSPRTTTPDISAQAAARLMRAEDVGSLVIIEDGGAVGIITEKDLVQKVVAESRPASKVRVHEIMSAPLVTIGPKESVANAARKMANLKLRRLPVIQEGMLVGLITENDVLRLSPSLIELTREWSRLGASGGMPPPHLTSEGYCENCGSFSPQLVEHEGMLICVDCLEQAGIQGDGE
jgi:CBS domain-containing protein